MSISVSKHTVFINFSSFLGENDTWLRDRLQEIAPWYMANEPYSNASYYEGVIIWVIDRDHITLLPHGPTVLNQAASEDPSPPYSHSVEPEEDIVRVFIDSYGGNWVN
jgi:hypothetical protein